MPRSPVRGVMGRLATSQLSSVMLLFVYSEDATPLRCSYSGCTTFANFCKELDPKALAPVCPSHRLRELSANQMTHSRGLPSNVYVSSGCTGSGPWSVKCWPWGEGELSGGLGFERRPDGG